MRVLALAPKLRTAYNSDHDSPYMSPIPDDLSTVKDDMVAFVEGHGMRRFHGYVDYDEVQCVMWETGGNPEGGGKIFLRGAGAAGAGFSLFFFFSVARSDT